MKLPNADQAHVDLAKLRDYCLDPNHLRGRHKARVFASALGLTADDAEELRQSLLSAALTEEAVATDPTEYGQRYVVDFTMERDGQRANLRSSWIVRNDEMCPRLTSCYVL